MIFSRTAKGLILLGIGTVLFLHTTGIITRGLDMLIIIFSILLIVYGLVELDFFNRVNRTLYKK